MRVTYNGYYKVEYPDLTDYHLLNAAEKLELERRAGYYDESGTITNVENRYDVYRRKYLEVQRGVDTYWLSQPLEATACWSGVHHMASTPSSDSTSFWPSSSGMQNRPVVRQSAMPESGHSTVTPL